MSSAYTQTTSHKYGITTIEARKIQQEAGFNELKVKNPDPLVKKILRQFTDLLVIILIIAGFLALFFGETVDAIVILSIVVINALIGFIQEFRTEKMLDALQKLVAPTARVIRDKKESTIPCRDVVPGDLILLTEGCRVPADAELIESNEIKVDEAILTGESLPVYKEVDSQKCEKCLILSGTTIVAGSGRAIVVEIGSKTEFGKIATLTTTTKKSESPLTKEMKTIGVFVSKISIIISAVLLLVGYFWQNLGFIDSLLFSIAVAVAAVPEGLPVTITTALALGMRRLASKNALVRELKSVETLGATTVICSDKTGTLTKNQMTVVRAWLPSFGEFKITGVGYDPNRGEVKITKNNLAAKQLFNIGDICNETSITKKRKSWIVIGDPTEGALKVVARKFGLPDKSCHYHKIFPFSSDRKLMSVITEQKLYSKGAPEHLLEKCTHFLDGKKIRLMDAGIRRKILMQTEKFANTALRVLACAYRETKNTSKLTTAVTAEKNLIFTGLIGMHDAPREEVSESVRLCQKAGIRITIVTGDNGFTAAAIAREIGIADKNTLVITGDELRKMHDRELKKLLRKKENLIFARVKPADKLRIVEIYKKLNEIVAVTGDGVNDAPALKRADIGVAMGRCGADVAKEAATLVLTNDSFASIVTAITEGRRIYANMRKFILYIFSCNIGELIVVFMAIILNLPLPLTAILILLVDLGTDLLPSLALGIDHADPKEMEHPPRNPQKRIMERGFISRFVQTGFLIGLLVLGGYVGVLYFSGWRWGDALSAESLLHRNASTFAFATLVIVQLFNAFNFRSETDSIFSRKIRPNFWLWGAVFISTALVLLIVELPIAQVFFNTTHLSFIEWSTVILLSGSIIFFEELRKKLHKNFCKMKS